MLVVGEDDPQWHLRELAHETGLEEGEVHAEGANERGCPLPLEQFGDDNVRPWCSAHPVADLCVSCPTVLRSSCSQMMRDLTAVTGGQVPDLLLHE